MATLDSTTINVQIDQDALRKQVSDAVQGALSEAAHHLYSAAYALNSEWMDEALEDAFKAGYDRGVQDAENVVSDE